MKKEVDEQYCPNLYVFQTLYNKKYITFGNMEWIVLAREGDKALLLSKDCIEERAFHEELKPMTWEACSLRSYLNGQWYDETFTEVEKAKILTTNVNHSDGICGASGGNDTEDKAFLLSIDEAERYFSTDHERITYLDGEAKWWWLRSPGGLNICAADVYDDGRVSAYGRRVSSDSVGVRPAIWINLES